MKSTIVISIALSLVMCSTGIPEGNTEKKVSETAIITEVTDKEDISGYSCDYFGEAPPGDNPVLFGQGIVSTDKDEICFEINFKGDAMIIDRAGTVILIEKNGDSWPDPVTAPFSGITVDGECCFAPGEDKIYFASRRNLQGATGDLNTWVSEKKDGFWSEPYPIKTPLWSGNTHAISVAASGNIYQSGIKVFMHNNGNYSPQILLSENTKGTHPFIAPDESYIIFCARSEGRWDKDLFISFNKNNEWTIPIALNNKINTKGKESNPFVTPDGKYLFFQRNNNIYWVDFNFKNSLQDAAEFKKFAN